MVCVNANGVPDPRLGSVTPVASTVPGFVYNHGGPEPRDTRGFNMARMLLTLLAITTVLFCGMSPARADWPTYQYDNARRGFTPETLAMPLDLGWVYTSPAPPEMAWEGPRDELFEGLQMRHRVAFDNVLHAVIVDQYAFFGSSVDNKVYCVNLTDGKSRWEFFAEGPVRLVPTVVPGEAGLEVRESTLDRMMGTSTASTAKMEPSFGRSRLV